MKNEVRQLELNWNTEIILWAFEQVHGAWPVFSHCSCKTDNISNNTMS